NKALKKTIKVHVTGGHLSISFPNVASGQAIISAIAVASAKQGIRAAAPSAAIIKNLSITDPAQTKKWKLKQWMDTGNKPYTDDDAEMSDLPPNLYGADWISVPKTTDNASARFELGAAADVYVALDESISQKPDWMQPYDDTKTYITNDAGGGHRFRVYHRRYQAGATVVLGNNGTIAGGKALMYTVAVLPVTHMEPATDLKPTISYKAETATLLSDGLIREQLIGRQYISFKKAAGDSISWAISTGVGDSHEFRIKYLNTTGKTLSAQFKLLAADGTVMKETVLEFNPTKADKSKAASTTTGNSINAGNYKIIIIARDAQGLSVSGLEVQ
ncbi:MAG TPA: glycoside hydrolase family 2, partial [Mucilaginibacter sp.]